MGMGVARECRAICRSLQEIIRRVFSFWKESWPRRLCEQVQTWEQKIDATEDDIAAEESEEEKNEVKKPNSKSEAVIDEIKQSENNANDELSAAYYK